MSRFSPTVRPIAEPALDFGPISGALRDLRERRRRDRLDEMERARYDQQQARLSDLDRIDREREAERLRVEAQGRAADLLSKGFELATTYQDPARARVTGVTSMNGLPMPTLQRGLERGVGMETTELEVDGSRYIYDPLRQMQRRKSELEMEHEARKYGERSGNVRAALEAGADPELVKRYGGFPPAGLTFGERQTLTAEQATARLTLEAYRSGERQKLQANLFRHQNALVRARQAGDVAGGKAALREYEMARDALQDGDARMRAFEAMIPDDPMRRQDAMQDPEMAAKIQDAENWVRSYNAPGGGRAKLEGDVDNARNRVRGGGAAPAAGGDAGKTPVSKAEYDDLVAKFGRERIAARYRIQ